MGRVGLVGGRIDRYVLTDIHDEIVEFARTLVKDKRSNWSDPKIGKVADIKETVRRN